MPPKKAIKLLEKTEKTEKTETPIVVNADDVDNPVEATKLKNKKNIITTKKPIETSIILTSSYPKDIKFLWIILPQYP